MMQEIPLKDGDILAPFFQHTYDSCPEAFLQGVMGRGFTDSLENPSFGVIQMGDFCFLSGGRTELLQDEVFSLIENLSQNRSLIVVPLSENWHQPLSGCSSLQRKTRYALDRPKASAFDRNALTSLICRTAYDADCSDHSDSREFTVKPVGERDYSSLQKAEWSRDFTGNYPDYPFYRQWGFGFVMIENATGKTAAGASSFSSSRNSIEIQIATDSDYRRRGLATAVSARMVLECLNRNKYPSWDAENLISVSIAEKLGYHFLKEYTAYAVNPGHIVTEKGEKDENKL